MECTENRKFDLNGVPDKLPEEAWAALKKASDERDLEEFREVSIQPRVDCLTWGLLTKAELQNLHQGGSPGHFCGYREEDA